MGRDLLFSVQFSHSVVSNSLRPHGLQQGRPPCPSPTPRVYSNSCPLSRWYHSAISFSVVPFSSCLQSFPASESFRKKMYQRISKKCISEPGRNAGDHWCKCWREICFYLLTWLVNLYITLDSEYLLLKDLGMQATLPKKSALGACFITQSCDRNLCVTVPWPRTQHPVLLPCSYSWLQCAMRFIS